MSPNDALSTSPPLATSPPYPSNGNSSASTLSFQKKPVPDSPSISVSAFSLPDDKKEDPYSANRVGFEHTRGNWGNRIVLTTYPGQSNVGTILLNQIN